MSRVACETCATTGMVMVMGEITTNAYVDIPKIVQRYRAERSVIPVENTDLTQIPAA